MLYIYEYRVLLGKVEYQHLRPSITMSLTVAEAWELAG